MNNINIKYKEYKQYILHSITALWLTLALAALPENTDSNLYLKPDLKHLTRNKLFDTFTQVL